jgi:hypothetical protein
VGREPELTALVPGMPTRWPPWPGRPRARTPGMMAWTLRWRIARLHHDSRAMGELAGQIAEPAESTPDGIAPSHCSSRSRGIPSGGDDTCAG